jgi:small conductance mechanosensitive channel
MLMIVLPSSHPDLQRLVQELKERWTQHVLDFIDKIPDLLVVGIIVFILIRLLKFLTNRIRHVAQKDSAILRGGQLRTLASVLDTAGYALIVFIGIVHILGIFHINVTPLIASAGVLGLAIGFGAQTIVHDVINGILILIENQFDVGDLVKAGGYTGFVEQMTLRRIVLRDGDSGALYTVPNSQITTVANLTRDFGKIIVKIPVDVREDADRVLSLLRQVAAEIAADPKYSKALREKPEVQGVDQFDGSQVIYPIQFVTGVQQQWGVARAFRKRVKEVFQENGILMGNPYRVLNAPPEGAPQSGNPTLLDATTGTTVTEQKPG